MTDWEAKIAETTANVARAKAIVAAQRDRIERLKSIGAPLEDAENTLMTFLATLAALEEMKEFVLTKAAIPHSFRPW